jgi:glutathione S-transferase
MSELKLYGYNVSPFARCTTFLIAHLNIKAEFVKIDLFKGEQK